VTNNGHHTTRQDVVFLINGIPVLVVECKNATKDEGIALGIDQLRRYHRETPEVMVPQQLFTATDAIGFKYGVTWNTVHRNIFEWKLVRDTVGGPPGPPRVSGAGSSGEPGGPPTGRFFDPYASVNPREHRLPHWHQPGVYCFVTWRMGDSLPREVLEEWSAEREAWLRQHPEPWTEATEIEYFDRFSRRMDKWVAAGKGSCPFRDPSLARIVGDTLQHFDGQHFELVSYVVMPNHVHVLFRPLGDHTVGTIVKSWKSFSAREVNKRLGKTGALWMDDYWDRLIRNEAHFKQTRDYIRNNPTEGGLKEGEYLLYEKDELTVGGPPGPPHTSAGTSGGPGGPPPGSAALASGAVGDGGRATYPPGRLEAKVKTFCAIPQVLALLKDYIVFAEKDEELNKYILRQHQTTAVERVVDRALDPRRRRGLVWHTQGSGKTFTMIKAAELLFKAPEADKPTVLLMIDRNELEDQMLKNLAALGLGNVEHAESISKLNKLLKSDYRGIVVCMVHKFRDMPANINTRRNIYVLIDEAHRTTGGDLGNYLMAGLPNASYLGFTGTPIDKTAYGRGTFKTFGGEDDKGYLHKYSIADSIADGTTLPLYYNLAPNELLVPHETLDKEFLSLAEAEGLADIEHLNKVLDRAVNLKNFLKGKERIRKVAEFVAKHYTENVEPLGYKAFLVGVDREACALYKHALDQFLPPEYSAVVYTGNNNDSALLKEFHLDEKKERQIRKAFTKLEQQPKILIVTEKLLTGFDAPVLYAMYLDKPMRDHTLLQAIARVNRPYENEQAEMVKPHGFVLDFVGIFDKLEKALAFDSDEINAIVKDIALLKGLFKNKMEQKVPVYIALVGGRFDDKDVDALIEHFRDPERRKEFFKEYKEVEMLYEIISPDAFMRPYIDTYATLSAIYHVVRKAYTKRVEVDREFQRKTNNLVQEHIGTYSVNGPLDLLEINERTIELIKRKNAGEGTKVINLIKSIERHAAENSDDPFLIAMAERAKAVQESFEDRQSSTAEALADLLKEVERNEQRKKEQAEKGFDGLTYFVYRTLLDAQVPDAESVSRKIKEAFVALPHWKQSEKDLRELRKKVTFAIYAQEEDLEKVTRLVEELFTLLEKADSI
jgi:type I restriction enzyme R subunit